MIRSTYERIPLPSLRRLTRIKGFTMRTKKLISSLAGLVLIASAIAYIGVIVKPAHKAAKVPSTPQGVGELLVSDSESLAPQDKAQMNRMWALWTARQERSINADVLPY